MSVSLWSKDGSINFEHRRFGRYLEKYIWSSKRADKNYERNIWIIWRAETQLNQLECQKDRTEFLSDYRDWVGVI